MNEITLIETPQIANPADSLLQIAVQRGANIDELDRLLALKEKHERREAEKAFVYAMAQFKANAPVLSKDRTVVIETEKGTIRYTHASLAEVCEKVTAGLGKYGLSHHWSVDQQQGGIIKVTCTITHALGHSVSTSMSSLPDTSGKKNAIQQVASTITYLERYTLTAITGLAARDMDDDGALSAEPQAQESKDYPQDKFDANFEKWKADIQSGKKTKEGLIAFIKGKGNITEQQLKQINTI